MPLEIPSITGKVYENAAELSGQTAASGKPLSFTI